ncbi:hypothetical protein [Campylobacter hyointestinalis]|uniref:hypothetical protein n=1 Tax=Campylobacter hyointestinalis TaxID=198 RepID=UPI00072BCAC0|nr:hypothetical protein [Campylobacter hyointestinalis]PPB63108.1 hypothetical protein CDQ72_01545 [Campylobacter hyointestinalis subsp. hyointestinalis]PPB65378.1 hypothetical protein CDQ73_01295 [Campylobacter hyointestinalis subsp. hyointestinalis]CUU72081.1 Uncharacterised protein [Campylobacter hyointestinalis subsp. hyointestinalis]
MIVSTNELADFLDLTPRRVQDLEVDGVFSKIARNQWDLKECFLKYLDYKVDSATSNLGLTEARAKKEFADAQLKELALAEKKEQVISIDKLQKELSDIAITLSNQLYNIPNRLKMNFELSDEVLAKLCELIEDTLTELKSSKTYKCQEMASKPKPKSKTAKS